jgi:WS/DGAT/MGAT family acyltransferase
LSLSEVKLIARWNETTVNDVLLAAVSGALRQYLLQTGHSAADLTAMVPFNLRGPRELVPRELGNRFGLVLLELPVGTGDAQDRLATVHERMRRIKGGRDGQVSYELLSVAGLLGEDAERRAVDFLSDKATAVMTNVPGPREPLYLAGVPISTALVWAPTSGHIGMSVSIFSYDDGVTIGVMVDPILVPDPDRIAALIESELDLLAHLDVPPSHTS